MKYSIERITITKLMSAFTKKFQIEQFYIFDSLPTLDKCCFLRSLKFGCILVIVIYVSFILQAVTIFIVKSNQCEFAGPISGFIDSLAGIICLLTAITTGVFLHGLIKKKHQFHIPFMYANLIILAFNFFTSITSMFIRMCEKPYLFGGANFAVAMLILYCLIIVNSHYKESVSGQSPSISNSPSASSSPRSITTGQTQNIQAAAETIT
ncbi:hypothetical protein HW555_005713 [Spodoptera exigua]|uniref:MARVEL domain-containing protein n=1 Tax=Spodoptera exigua TaxID=7107 RepID=A0A835GHW8_SPOEX|nr:hypothetical protein HW555_005713 [Spodoptera exigua]